MSAEEIQNGLRQIMGGPDTTISFVAAKILEDIDMDGSLTLEPDDFLKFARGVYQKHVAGWMDDEPSTHIRKKKATAE